MTQAGFETAIPASERPQIHTPPKRPGVGIPHSKHAASLQRLGRLFMKLNAIYSESN
jgi:hypothetical protein